MTAARASSNRGPEENPAGREVTLIFKALRGFHGRSMSTPVMFLSRRVTPSWIGGLAKSRKLRPCLRFELMTADGQLFGFDIWDWSMILCGSLLISLVALLVYPVPRRRFLLGPVGLRAIRPICADGTGAIQ